MRRRLLEAAERLRSYEENGISFRTEAEFDSSVLGHCGRLGFELWDWSAKHDDTDENSRGSCLVTDHAADIAESLALEGSPVPYVKHTNDLLCPACHIPILKLLPGNRHVEGGR